MGLRLNSTVASRPHSWKGCIVRRNWCSRVLGESLRKDKRSGQEEEKEKEEVNGGMDRAVRKTKREDQIEEDKESEDLWEKWV